MSLASSPTVWALIGARALATERAKAPSISSLIPVVPEISLGRSAIVVGSTSLSLLVVIRLGTIAEEMVVTASVASDVGRGCSSCSWYILSVVVTGSSLGLISTMLAILILRSSLEGIGLGAGASVVSTPAVRPPDSIIVSSMGATVGDWGIIDGIGEGLKTSVGALRQFEGSFGFFPEEGFQKVFEGSTFHLRNIVSDFTLDIGPEVIDGNSESAWVASVKGVKEMDLTVWDGTAHGRVDGIELSFFANISLTAIRGLLSLLLGENPK